MNIPKYEEINWDIVVNVNQEYSLDRWITEQKKATVYLISTRGDFKQFEHLGKTLFVRNLPWGYRILANTTNGCYRWAFTDEIGGFIECNVPELQYAINMDTAPSMDDAIALFRTLVTRLRTGLDAVLETK